MSTSNTAQFGPRESGGHAKTPQHAKAPKHRRNWPLIAAAIVTVTVSACAGAGGERSQADPPKATTSDSVEDAGAGSAQPETDTGAPTTTDPTTSRSKPPEPPQVVRGSGDDVVKVTYGGDLKLLKFSCPSCSSNTTVETDGAESLPVNEIGSYEGTHWLDVEEHSSTSQITVKANSAWTLKVGGLDMVKRYSGKAGGRGDDVVLLDSGESKARIANHGGSDNFVVQTAGLDTGDMDIPVNEIGGYEGTVPMELPALVQVQSSGNWSITPKQ